MKNPHQLSLRLKVLVISAAALVLGILAPGTNLKAQSSQQMETYQIFVGESEKIRVTGLTRVIISDPNVVEVIVPTTDVIVLNAKQPGTSILTLFERDSERMIRILVVENNVALATRIKAAIGYPGVRVIIAEQNIILEGDVETQDERNRAVTIASAFLPAIRGQQTAPQSVSNVFNTTTYPAPNTSEGDVADASAFSLPTPEGIFDFLRVTNPRQIRLRIQVVRIGSNALKDFGLRFAEQAIYGIGYNEQISGPGRGASGQKPWLGDQVRRLVHGLVIPQGSEVGYSVALRTLENEGKAKTLARPVITTLDGAEASFLAGGKVILNSSTVVGGQLVTTTFTEEVGVKVFFRPKIMPNGNINLFVTPKVAEPPVPIDAQGSVFIAARNTRNNVEMRPGDTMILAGLFSIDEAANVNKFPWLAEIPIIGELFKNRVRRGGQEEVMFLVTPEIVTTPSNLAVGPSMGTEMGATKVFLQEQRVFSSMASDELPYGNPDRLGLILDEPLPQADFAPTARRSAGGDSPANTRTTNGLRGGRIGTEAFKKTQQTPPGRSTNSPAAEVRKSTNSANHSAHNKITTDGSRAKTARNPAAAAAPVVIETPLTKLSVNKSPTAPRVEDITLARSTAVR